MRVLVTGVAGFIGSNLTHALLKRGYSVIGIDNLSEGNQLNLDDFRSHPAFELHTADIRDEVALSDAARGCEAIVHLAAFKIPRYSDALDTLLVNGIGSLNICKVAHANRAKLVAASTSDVYGKNPAVPFSETSDLVMGNPDVRRWAYAISKMFGEQLLFAHHERHALDVVVLRFFGGYGPNQHLDWLGGPQAAFITSALDDKELELHGDGQQSRSFTYVDDHVDGIIPALENPAANNLVFNLGNTTEITIEALARLVWRLVRGDSLAKIRFVPYSTFGKYEDVRRRVPDIRRAREVLGFEPKTDLETGLRETISWQVARRRQLGIPTPELRRAGGNPWIVA